MSHVIFSIGIPASGKTTFLKQLADWHSCECIGPDALRLEKYGDETAHVDDKEVWTELRARIAGSLQSGKDIIIDSSFHKKERREHFITFIRAHGATHIEGIYFEIPLQIILERGMSREENGGKSVSSEYAEQAYAELQDNVPHVEEGFDALYTIDQNGLVTTVASREDTVLYDFFTRTQHAVLRSNVIHSA